MKNLILTLIFVITYNLTTTAQTISVKKSGKGEPMLFFPHIGCSSEMWNLVVQHYEKNYTCYQFDFAGFAGMKPIEGNYSEQYVAAIRQYIKENKLKHIILVGQNYGAFIAVKVALEEKANIKKIVASDFYPALKMVLDSAMTDEKLDMIKNAVRQSTITPDADTFAKNQNMVANGMNFLDTTHVKTFVKWQLASDRKTLAETLCEQLTENLIVRLQNNHIPLLAISTWYFAKTYKNMPETDAPKQLNKMFAGTPNVTHALTSETKDFIHMDAPAWYLKVTEQFIKDKI